MSLVKTTILTLLVLGLCLAIYPLSVSVPRNHPATDGTTPPVSSANLRQPVIEHRPGIAPAAKPVARSTSVAAPEIRLPPLYPELERIIALENRPASEAIVSLQPLLVDADPVIRLAALQVLADMSHPQRSQHLTALLQDPEAQVRIAALEALGESRDTTPTVSIEALLFDAELEVRITAIDTLAALENAQAVYSLAGLLGDTDTRIRAHTVNALGEIGGEVAVGYLLQARYDAASNIRASAEAILRELGAPIADR